MYCLHIYYTVLYYIIILYYIIYIIYIYIVYVHIKRYIILCQTLRVKRIYSKKNALDGHVENLKECFFQRRYPDNLLKKQVERAIRPSLSDKMNKWRTISSDI